MKDKLIKLAYFLHIYDGEGQLDLEDLAFIAVMVKIILNPSIDWAAVCSLVPVILSQMHVRHIDSKKNS